MIKITTEGATEGLDSGRFPAGDIGERAILDLAIFAVRLTNEDSGGRFAIGNGRNVHVD